MLNEKIIVRSYFHNDALSTLAPCSGSAFDFQKASKGPAPIELM